MLCMCGEQYIRHIRRYNISYATSGTWQEIRHTRKYRMYAISGNVMYDWRTIYTPHQAIQYIVRHTRKYKKYATSGNTGCTPYKEMLRTIFTPHQEIQYIVRHIRKYKKYAISGNTMFPYATSGNLTPFWCGVPNFSTPHQEILYATSVNTPHQVSWVCVCVLLDESLTRASSSNMVHLKLRHG